MLANFMNMTADGDILDWNEPETDLVVGICPPTTASSGHKNTTACFLISGLHDSIDPITAAQVLPC